MKNPRKLKLSLPTIRAALASRWFWYVIVGIFLFNALWVALMGAYPLVYDEAYHIGIIDVYSHQWLPFIQSQNDSTAYLGDITRYGSYLYHYLMSFPYRLLIGLGVDQSTSIVLLRLMNIGIFVAVIYWMRSLLRILGFSRPITQLSVFIVTLLPIFPYLSATVNYDSLFLLSTAIFLTLAVRLLKNKTPSLVDVSALVIVGCLGSITKYTFLPIFAVTGLVVAVSIIRRHNYFMGLIRTANLTKIRTSWRLMAAIVLVVLSLGLFAERYGVNVVAYHQPEPNCSKTHTVDFCRHWGPWRLSYDTAQANKNPEVPSVKGFVEFVALYWMRDIVNNASLMGGVGSLSVASYWSLRILHFAVPFMLLFCLLGIFHPKLRKVRWVSAVFIVYVAMLMVVNYRGLIETGMPSAIQARYLIWFLPVIMAYTLFVGASLLRTVGQYNTPSLIAIGIVGVLCGSQFAGNITYWYRQTPVWINNDETAQQLNDVMRNVAEKVVIGP